ncbi:MAG: hypothetical protein J2P36_35380, partial [Ktedonobacteraceae bacterium]|nr:hypothetical protein [Ktedonobacteraceae bacterium]
ALRLAVLLLLACMMLLKRVRQWYRECVRTTLRLIYQMDPDDMEACMQHYGQRVAEKMPEEVPALEPLCTAALAVVMRLSSVRTAICHDAAFVSALTSTTGYSSAADCLSTLSQVLDNEEIIVLHPGLKCGYRIRIRGVSDNFQLHTLLADALIGDPNQRWLPGQRPDPRVAAAANNGPFPLPGEEDAKFPAAEGAFNLWNWQGLQSDGTLPKGGSNSEHWVWNEGTPADIEHFEGTRVILLGPPPYHRSWNAGRFFPGLDGELEVLEIASPAPVDDWLARIITARSA